MANLRKEQLWILDALTGIGGYDVLHPEIRGFIEEIGYYHTDLDRVFGKAKAATMYAKAWATTAREVEKKAEYAEKRGWRTAARDFYIRAVLLYGRARYSYFKDDPRKMVFNEKVVKCFEKVIAYSPTPIERVVLDFEGKKIYATLHLNGSRAKSPAVVLGPGMDMFKEDWCCTVEKHFLPRGFVALAIDGPGQGETLTGGCKVSVDNYERAGKAFIDYLSRRPEVDSDKISWFGVSMGSYWGHRTAAHDPRIKALATAMGNTGRDMDKIFNMAQPNFKMNFMYMAGYEDEEKFNREIFQHMKLGPLVEKVKCPSLMVHGEFDELTPLEEVFETYERVPVPKEIWVMDNEFHPMGGMGRDWVNCIADWLVQMLDGKYDKTMDRRLYWKKTGEIIEGDMRPPYWSARD
jgi:pimeloyl-ACP methyl ester carboxylesterase